jgi:hypothetical protein
VNQVLQLNRPTPSPSILRTPRPSKPFARTHSLIVCYPHSR